MGWSTCYRREAGSAGKDTRRHPRPPVHRAEIPATAALRTPCRVSTSASSRGKRRCLGPRSSCPNTTAAGDPAPRRPQVRLRGLAAHPAALHVGHPNSNCTTPPRRAASAFVSAARTGMGSQSPRSTARWPRPGWIVAFLENHQQADGSDLRPRPCAPTWVDSGPGPSLDEPRALPDGPSTGEAAQRPSRFSLDEARSAPADLPTSAGQVAGRARHRRHGPDLRGDAARPEGFTPCRRRRPRSSRRGVRSRA